MQNYLSKVKSRTWLTAGLVISVYLCNWMCTSPSPGSAAAGSAASGSTASGAQDAGTSLSNPVQDSYGRSFAGSATCASCHAEIYAASLHTAHYLDSRPAAPKYISGNIDSGNHFVYSNHLEVALERRGGRIFQTAFRDGKEFRSEPIDMVIGSGRRGQTYLYWNDGRLFQLPLSYSTALHAWCNSPGYPDSAARYDRPIPASCLECHTTYAKTSFHNNTDRGDFFDKDQLIYGIGCERCHGPGSEHVAWHQEHPGEKEEHSGERAEHSGERMGKYIINTRLLSRQQRLDGCALCHSGRRSPLLPAFSFRAGDKLDDFSTAGYVADSAAGLDVHGNQYGLLTSSKCFRRSQMTCSSCHNVHNNESSNFALLSQRCMVCHTAPAAAATAAAPHSSAPASPSSTPASSSSSSSSPSSPHPPFCRLASSVSPAILEANCIDCHMPALPSQKITLMPSGSSSITHQLVRTHRIAIYQESTKKYLQQLRH